MNIDPILMTFRLESNQMFTTYIGMKTERAMGPIAQLGVFWCRLMHPAPMWPRHGHYQCPKCQRVYQVPWYPNIHR